jgi:hypothetical protein
MPKSKSKLLYDWQSVGQSVSMSWCRTPLWDLWPGITSCRNVAVLFLTRGRVCKLQCNHSKARVAQNPQPYFTASSETPPHCRARFLHLYHPGTEWPNCTDNRLTVNQSFSQSVCLGVEHPCEYFDQILSCRNVAVWNLRRCRSRRRSYIMTDIQSVSMSWCQAGTCQQIFTSCRNVAVWKLRSCFCRAPSLTRGRLCKLQCNHSMVRVVSVGRPLKHLTPGCSRDETGKYAIKIVVKHAQCGTTIQLEVLFFAQI